MKTQDAAALERMAVLHPDVKRERLNLWAKLLALHPRKIYETFTMIECLGDDELARLDITNTPLEPLFRDAGCAKLGIGAGRTVSEAMRFLGISRDELHNALCYCHQGPEISGEEAMKNVEALRDGKLVPVPRDLYGEEGGDSEC